MYRQFIYVPKTAKDMKADWYGDETAAMYKWNLPDDEFQSLWECRIFEYLNAKLEL